VSPHFTWSQDVKGTSPLGGNFIEGRHSFGVGIGANLQNRWEIDLNYAAYGGGNYYNQLRDRDFVAATVKFSF